MEMLSYVGCLLKIKENEEIKVKENTLSLILAFCQENRGLGKKIIFLLKNVYIF